MRRAQFFLITFAAAFAAAAPWSTGWCGEPNDPQSNFIGLGDLPGGPFSSSANDVSADGSVVVGSSVVRTTRVGGGRTPPSTLSLRNAFRWTEDGGMVSLGTLSEASLATSSASAASADGSTVVGSSGVFNTRGSRPQLANDAFRWRSGPGLVGLGAATTSAQDVSANGRVIVGTGSSNEGTEAFRWRQGSGRTGLGDLPGGTFGSFANGVSADGSVVVGSSFTDAGNEAFRWTQASAMVGLGDLAGGAFESLAIDVSANGDVVVGRGTSEAGSEAFRWTQGSGMLGLGDLPGGAFFSFADEVSADGAVVVGFGTTDAGSEAFIWDAAHGMRNLRDVLVNQHGLGNSLVGWTLYSATGVSADGQVIVGTGRNPDGFTEAWRARLGPEPALPGDYNRDGTIDAADYVVWRKGLGTIYTAAGYDDWRAHFGTVSPGIGAGGDAAELLSRADWLSSAVPETSTLWLSAIAAFGLAMRNRPQSYRTNHRRVAFLPLLASVFLCAATSREAQSARFAFQLVAGENTALPGGNNFLDVFTPSLQGGQVAFLGLHDDGKGLFGGEGIYSISPNGMLAILVDSNTLVPGATVPFDRFGLRQSIDGNRVVFNALAFPESGPDIIEGYYVVEDGIVTAIADLNTPLPSGTGNFTFLWNPDESPSAHAGQVAFVGGGENDRWGIYTARGGTLSRLVDTSTPVPNDTRTFRYFGSPVLAGDRLAFLADLDDNTQGIYLHDLATGTLSVVADSNTPLPGGVGNFTSFGFGPGSGLDFDGDIIAFVGDVEFRDHGALGIYRYDLATGALTTIAEDGTPVPGQPTEQFGSFFQSVSVDDGQVAFQYGAFVESRFEEFLTPFYGIYSDLGGPLEKVLALGDMLDGIMVDMPGPRSSPVLEIGPEALDGNQIAMLVQLEDGSRAIYIAKLIPEPATMTLIVPAALATLFGWRRCQGSRSSLKAIRYGLSELAR
jgi:probable HAF family extracellular repeat protein